MAAHVRNWEHKGKLSEVPSLRTNGECLHLGFGMEIGGARGVQFMLLAQVLVVFDGNVQEIPLVSSWRWFL